MTSGRNQLEKERNRMNALASINQSNYVISVNTGQTGLRDSGGDNNNKQVSNGSGHYGSGGFLNSWGLLNNLGTQGQVVNTTFYPGGQGVFTK